MKKWILPFLIFIVLASIGTFIKIYITAMAPIKSAEQNAISFAEKKAYIKKVTNYQLYHGLETVDVVEGTNKRGEKIIVWIPEKSKKVIVKRANSGLSKAEAIQKVVSLKHPEKIVAVRLGMEKNTPLWEIYYLSNHNLINYYYISFESGEWLRNIENL
ncbi:MAG: DUF5590 domain-containing protein [Bacillota bacterium]|nr:DUF5590 domain-containing protein [Bacillota bacterium]